MILLNKTDCTILEEAGFIIVGYYLMAKVFSIPYVDSDQYVRVFLPQIIKKNGQKTLVGVLASIKKPALENLHQIQRLSNYYILSSFSANFPALRNPPIISSSEPIEYDWCKLIACTVAKLPRNPEELSKVIIAGGIAGAPLRALGITS